MTGSSSSSIVGWVSLCAQAKTFCRTGSCLGEELESIPKADKILLDGLFEPEDLVSAFSDDRPRGPPTRRMEKKHHQIYLHVNTGAHHPLNPGLVPFKTRPDQARPLSNVHMMIGCRKRGSFLFLHFSHNQLKSTRITFVPSTSSLVAFSITSNAVVHSVALYFHQDMIKGIRLQRYLQLG